MNVLSNIQQRDAYFLIAHAGHHDYLNRSVLLVTRNLIGLNGCLGFVLNRSIDFKRAEHLKGMCNHSLYYHDTIWAKCFEGRTILKGGPIAQQVLFMLYYDSEAICVEMVTHKTLNRFSNDSDFMDCEWVLGATILTDQYVNDQLISGQWDIIPDVESSFFKAPCADRYGLMLDILGITCRKAGMMLGAL